ncbi:ribonuclease S-4-like [Vicia villosa]|uniref:ribonuclease S-4-like n=1 Tax=Vicia villosa TaxID=3911 RepID=UPI00273C4025|nr:ribonuclease S-4-like [Vicia villosa]
MSSSHSSLLLVTFIVCAVLISQSAAVPFNYLKLVLQWGPTVCEVYEEDGRVCKISPIVDKLTIHGIWPSTLQEPQPRDCTTTNPDGMHLREYEFSSALLTRMDKFWPSYYFQDFRQFWRQQWNAHGRCSYPSIQQKDYVKLAINLAEALDILEALKKAGIVPRSNREDTKYWSRELLIDAVKIYGFRKGIRM